MATMSWKGAESRHRTFDTQSLSAGISQHDENTYVRYTKIANLDGDDHHDDDDDEEDEDDDDEDDDDWIARKRRKRERELPSLSL
uniref:Uncharacterized protein n=1 Tax=Vespula pensylvanica TaxID=30213 RepID=A0A834NSF5_VESPE|nr:hypothetical protein H0235_011748 [Vespula pensylvanica]